MIVGSGYIAVEFAGIFAGFGSEVDIVFRADKVLRGFDIDLRNALMEEMTKKRSEFRRSACPNALRKTRQDIKYISQMVNISKRTRYFMPLEEFQYKRLRPGA